MLIVGAGVAGLAAARAFARRGVDDVHLLELEDDAGGNSRGHAMDGLACPLGAHYLPLPGPEAPEVAELLLELGLVRHELGRTVYDERHLCHSPQERLFIDGAWVEGVLPPAEAGLGDAGAVPPLRRRRRSRARGPWLSRCRRTGRRGPTAMAALDAVTFDAWLDQRRAGRSATALVPGLLLPRRLWRRQRRRLGLGRAALLRQPRTAFTRRATPTRRPSRC